MHTDNAENLMLCNLYIIKLVEHSQTVRAYNHPLKQDKCLGWKVKVEKKYYSYRLNVCERCKVDVMVRCFAVWLNVVCHTHDKECWGMMWRSDAELLGICCVGSDPVWGIEEALRGRTDRGTGWETNCRQKMTEVWCFLIGSLLGRCDSDIIFQRHLKRLRLSI